jgi:hypothetical protein
LYCYDELCFTRSSCSEFVLTVGKYVVMCQMSMTLLWIMSSMDETIFYKPLTADTSRKHTLINFYRWFRHTPRNSAGLLPFLVFIKDIPDSVTSNARLFADECLLYRVVNTNAISCSFRKTYTNLRNGEIVSSIAEYFLESCSGQVLIEVYCVELCQKV